VGYPFNEVKNIVHSFITGNGMDPDARQKITLFKERIIVNAGPPDQFST
jgi:hypothetical protein